MPPSPIHWLDIRFGNNTVRDLLVVIFILLMIAILRRFFSVVLSKLIFKLIRKRSQSSAVQSFVKLLSKPIEWLITLLAVYVSAIQLDLRSVWNLDPVHKPGILMFMKVVFEISVIWSLAFFAVRIIEFFALEFLQRSDEQEKGLMDKQLLPFFKELLKIFVWILAFFFSLGFVFNLNVANIVAGLGLGGLAVALAAKESLENLFASFTIFLDKPFVVGDLVTVNNITGTVEKVGFRSTRIRTLEKSFLTLPNKLMIDNALDNLSLRTHRRSDMNISLLYDTPKEKMETLLADLQNTLNQHPRCTNESLVRFVQFGDSALIIRILYYVDTLEFEDFLKVKEEINFLILEMVRRSGCEFAFPTQTLFVNPTQISDHSKEV